MAKPIEIFFQVTDVKGDKSTVTIPIPITSIDDAPGFGTAMAAILAPLINGALTDAGFSVPVSYVAWGAANALSDVQEKARFAFRTITGFLKRVSLPAFLEDLFSPGSKSVNTADLDVAAFITAMEDGVLVGGNTVQPCDGHGDSLTNVESAVEEWGRSRG
jgi:hypothetical protein